MSTEHQHIHTSETKSTSADVDAENLPSSDVTDVLIRKGPGLDQED